jgi:hypothetical protein
MLEPTKLGTSVDGWFRPSKVKQSKALDKHIQHIVYLILKADWEYYTISLIIQRLSHNNLVNQIISIQV